MHQIKNKKRLCFISPAIYPLLCQDTNVRSAGGSEIQLKTIGCELAEMGYEIHFITDDYGQPPVEKVGKVWVHNASFRYLGKGKRYLLIDWLKLVRTAYKIGAKRYFLKLPKDALLPLGFLCRLTNRKLVYIGQSDKDVDLKLLFKVQSKIAASIYRLGMFFVNTTIAQTEIQLKGFRNFGKQSSLIKNVVTFPLVNFTEKDNSILWVGNDTINKQAHVVPELALQLPDFQFKMILATKNGSKADILFKQKSLKIKNFEYLGFVPFHQIAPYFTKAKIFINTSLREGFPNVFLQAWQNATPVISLNVDPDQVIIKHSIGVCTKGDLSLFIDSINKFMTNKEFTKKTGRLAKKYISEEHDLAKGVQKYIKVIES